MQAEFEVVANGADITPLLRDRLISIQITDKSGLTSDSCDIRVDDRDGKVAIPPRGATLTVSLGWAGSGLSYLGTFLIDEVTLESSPMTLTIHGKGADMRQSAKSQHCEGYENTTLAAIVAKVAKRHGWQPVCQVTAAIARADQLNESDLNFITRMARGHGATATVKDGKLLVLPRGGGKRASGEKLPDVKLTPDMLSQYRFAFADRATVAAVKTMSHDARTGKQSGAEAVNAQKVPGGGAVYVDRTVYACPQTAKAVAAARLEALNRDTAKGTLSMLGRADIGAERKVILQEFKHGVDGDYLVESVTHSFDGKSWQMQVAINGGNDGKAKVGHGQAGKGGKVLLASTQGK